MIFRTFLFFDPLVWLLLTCNSVLVDESLTTTLSSLSTVTTLFRREIIPFVEVSCLVFLFLFFFNRGGYMDLQYHPDR